MASSASFRARRPVDPKPIHYGSFVRELRNTTSLNDLDAAWENVDEARTALQTVEARIREANLGIRHERHDQSTLDEPSVREVFSQKQRLGRVSRYELRPTINEHQYPRETDQSPRRSLSEFPLSRKSPRSAYTSYNDYRSSKYYDRQHSPPSRDLRSLSPLYINNYVNDDKTDDDDLSLQRNGVTRDITSPSGSGNIQNDEEAQEISSVKRKKINGFSPLSPVVSATDQSDALTRLKERIKKQKERTPAPKQKENEDAVVNVIQPSNEERPAIEDNEDYTVKPVCKRKVVTAAPPTGYKGFSMPSSEPKDICRTHSRTSNFSSSSKAGQKRSSGPHKQTSINDGKISKGGVKMRRITAPKPPMDFITPYSWRTGMDTVKKVLGPSRPKSSASTRPQSAASQATTSMTAPCRTETVKQDEKQELKERREVNEEHSKRKITEEKIIDEEKKFNDTDLSEGLLSEEAKSILSDLDSDSSDDEDKAKEVRAVLEGMGRNTNVQKDEQKPKKGKPYAPKKRLQHKPKSSETVPPKSSLQKNYDVDKVKKYMEKQIKDRKQKIKEEKKMKQEAVNVRRKKLESLYNKQKKILTTNLTHNSAKHKMGETHSVLPGHSKFQHQQLGYLPEFASPEESEKESTDVGSYVGLPTPSPRSQYQPTTTIDDDHPVSEISSDASLRSLDSDHLYSTKRREESKDEDEEMEEDNPADVTLTPDQPSCPGSSRRVMNGEREEREEWSDERQVRYPGIPSDEVQGPSRTSRIEALKNTAAALTHRLEQEAKRLGLSLMDEKPSRPSNVTVKETDIFKGNLPGVNNLHEQAELNDQLDSMNSAATRIQAVYRGYSTRQGLNWRLPSGRTLGGIIRNAPRQTPIEGRAESIPLYLVSDTSSDSHLSDVETAYSHESDRSGSSRHGKPGSSADNRSYSGIHNSEHGEAGTGPTLSKGHYYRPSTTLGKALADGKGDRMSVINIYLRNLNTLRQGEEKRPVEPVQNQDGHDTASLYSDDFQADKTSDTASLLEDLKDDTVDLDKTLVKLSPVNDSLDRKEQNVDNALPDVDRSYAHSVSSHGSPSRSSTISLTDTEYSPIRQSNRSVSPQSEAAKASTHPDQPSTYYRPPVFFPSHQGGDRMSPGSLDRQMIAELNRLEFMEESVRQLTDIEQTNAVSLAQQETVSLAQILKAKQTAYAKEMESLQLKAQKEKMDAARELDEARYSAKKSSLDAQETIARVKTDAAHSIAQSTDKLVTAQTEASRTTTESAKKVEEARNEAARALLDNANQQITDIRTVASTAASAAAQEAVRTTLEQYRQDLRPPRKYDTSHSTPDSRSRTHSTPDSRSRGSYSRDSYSNERSPSYSRSRSTRSVSERRSGASKSASGGGGGGGGDGYTSDEFESLKETDPTRSVRTATPNRSHASNQVDGSFIDNRERSGAKSSDSITEEIDASISEGSIASDSIVADKSVVEAIDDEHFKNRDKTDHDYSMTFEESVVSSRNATDDEMDYRLILPSEGHRRRSIEKLGRSTSICSDAVSYSSDENFDKHLSESVHEKTTPFSREDSFSKFTTDMVKLMREEEVRAKHLEALLHLREKALKENTTAEMEWLELQKKQMRDKGADDAMPFIKKRQRDVIKRLKTEKAEIKYLMAAHRAARYDRKLMMMNQEEITRLRRSTQKIRGKVREEEQAAVVAREKNKSDVPEALSPPTRRSTPVSANQEPYDSPSNATTVPEEISAIESPTADTSFPTYDNEPSVSDGARKRSLSEGESDDGAQSSSVASKSKGSPSTSDSIVMQRLKKLKSQSSERYLTQREQKLMRRKHEGDEVPLSDRKLNEWERRLADEEDKLNDVNRLKTKRAIKATETQFKEDDIVMAPDRSREGSLPEVDYISKEISEASDHSDVETRVRELREQLQQREREVRRLHKEQKRQKRAMLHEEEENLRKKLQAVERILQKTKENLERPAAEFKPRTTTDTSSKPTPKQSPSEKLSVYDDALPSTSKQLEKTNEEEDKGAVVPPRPRPPSSEGSVSEKLPSSRDMSIEEALSESKQSRQSSSSDGPLKHLNVVLDLDFSSQNHEEPKDLDPASQDRGAKSQSISEVKDLDLSDRSGLFDREPSYTPFSQSDEIEDDAKTAEDVSEASEIKTMSGASANDEHSRSQSSRQSLQDVVAKRSGDESQGSIAEEISQKPDERSGEESISEAISARSSRRSGSESESISEVIPSAPQRSGDESISEALSARSKRSGDESISEALPSRSKKSDNDSISEVISAGSKRSGTRSISEATSARSNEGSLSEAKKSEKEVSSRRSKTPANDYSNTFESEHDKHDDQTDDDISEHLIADESRESIKDTPQKSYSSDFEPSETNIATLDVKHESPKNASYSQDFELPSSKDEEPSRGKSIHSKRSFIENECDDSEQRRLSQATDKDSISEELPVEEIEEDRHSIESGALSDEDAAHFDSSPKIEKEQEQVSAQEDDNEESEKDISGYSQDFETSVSQRISKSLSKELKLKSPEKSDKSISEKFERESPEKSRKTIPKEDRSESPHKESRSLSKNKESERKLDEPARPTGDATDEESVAEEIPEDDGSMVESDELITPRFSLKDLQIENKDEGVHTSKTEEKHEDIEEKELSYSSEDFESPSSHRVSKHGSKEDSHENEPEQKSLSKAEEPRAEHEVSQHRLSEGTDDESVAEEIPDEDVSLEFGELSYTDDKTPKFIDTKEKTTDVELGSKPDDVALPENKDVEISSERKPYQEELRKNQADKIVQDISTSLVNDAVSCMSNLYDEHKHRTSLTQETGMKTAQPSVNIQTDATAEAKADSEKEDSINEWGKPPEEGFEISEGEDLSISEKLSFTDDEGSLPLPMIDYKPAVATAVKGDQIPKHDNTEEKQVKIDKKEQNENVLKELSENLLKEAATKMISLMRQKQAKLKAMEKTPTIEKKELPKSPPPHSPELSPRSFDKYMAVMKQSSPPGSPTKDGSGFDGNELADKLTQLKLLHDELGAHLGDDDDDDDFVINANKPLELPTEKEVFGPPGGQAIPIVVPHSFDDVASVVSTSLAAFYRRKKSGGSLGNVTPPPECSDSNIDVNDPDSKLKQSYRRMIFDLTGEVFRDVLTEESPLERPTWMKPRRRRKNRFYHSLSPVTDEHDYLPIVQQRVMDLVGLGNQRPNLDTLRRKTPLKIGKKDFVDAVLIQELREEEPQWIDYDDDELAVKFQVADAIFESLLSETVMVLNAVQRRKESEKEVVR